MLQVEAHAMRVNLNRGYEFAAPHARSGFSFYRGREEAVHYDRLRRLIVECYYGRESIEAV
jgi:hypothetical protein